MWDEDDKVNYLVVEDGAWLVYHGDGWLLTTYSDERFAIVFTPAQES